MTAMTAIITCNAIGQDATGANCPQLALDYPLITSWTLEGQPDALPMTLNCTLDSTVLDQIQGDSNYTVVSSAPVGS